MENVAAKAYFGLTVLRSHCVAEKKKLAKGQQVTGGESLQTTTTIQLPEKEWLANYQQAPAEKRKIGTGLNTFPYYEDLDGNKVVVRFGTKAVHYNPLETAFRVITDLDNQIARYAGERTDVMDEIQADLAIAVSEQLIKKSLNDSDHRRIVDDAIARMGQKN